MPFIVAHEDDCLIATEGPTQLLVSPRAKAFKECRYTMLVWWNEG